ncbi:hypothetical protein Cadr_000027797 [Camelus dromedarius]|uniref:Uncharacterized protein n=1 Tax=Camelus dromedarius TaxID=9838 RepID=A0A5N4CAJ1_CAMDR|nr:hypothetical protein Cadr_000027797 [Camelus dromedarius]
MKSRKLMIMWNGIRKVTASWEAEQKATSVLRLEDYLFIVQIMFLQDKNFINVLHMERV